MIHSKDVRNLADTAPPPAPTPTHALRGMDEWWQSSMVRRHYARSSRPSMSRGTNRRWCSVGFGDITAFAGIDDATPGRSLRN